MCKRIISMDYKKIYDKIIENRKQNPLKDGEYGEKHHIIPRSLSGSDNTENLVKLTAREHFICHALLSEMYEKESFEWYKMNHAFMLMKGESFAHKGNRYYNSKLYELKRKDFAIVNSWNQTGERNSQYGKPRSEETKNKIRKALKYDKPTKREIRDLQRKIIKESIEEYNIKYYNELFEKFEKSNYRSIREFVRDGNYNKSHVSLTYNFKKYVKKYNPLPNRPYIAQLP